ncbi:MAG: DMT family transporter [Candidatus Nanohaloarchaeota archaeon QJJ-9]|nr:DMT family transporter [Candidatus Nanohaloarchaeota archaeon QJJ-9]
MLPWYFFALATAFLAAFASIVEKRTLSFKDESPIQYATTFGVINAALSFVLLPLADFSFPLTAYAALYLCSVIGSTAGFYLIAKALKSGEISKVSPLLNINPVFVAVLAMVFLGESLSKMQYMGIGLTVVGSYVLESDGGFKHLLGPLKRLFTHHTEKLMLAATGLYAAASILNKYVLGFTDSITVLILLQAMVAFNFLCMMLFRARGSIFDRLRFVEHEASVEWHWVLVAALLTTSYRLLQMQAFSMAMVSLVVPIKRLSTLIATVIGGELFREDRLLHKVVACIVMIVGAYLVIVM